MFLLANITMQVILKIFFLTLNKIEANFANQKLIWKTCTPIEALSTRNY